MAAQDTELFSDILNLENEYHSEGYALGIADGTRAGRIEGRVFGLEKGFEKFAEMGRLGGRANVWKARLPGADEKEEGGMKVAPLSGSDRLKRHVEKLVDLTDPAKLPTENSEEDVNDVDGSMREAKAKTTLIKKIVGEEGSPSYEQSTSTNDDKQPARNDKPKRTGEMEDFVGLPNVRSTK